MVTRRQIGLSRTTWIVALSVFAVSAFHLSQHTGDESAWVALLGHHASLPLAVAILYQDYRFALVDTFLKRALSVIAIVAIAFGLYVAFAARLLAWRGPNGELDTRAVVAVMGLWIATAFAYPVVRDAIAWFVDVVVLRRADYGEIRASIARRLAELDSESAILDDVCRRTGDALGAGSASWRQVAEGDPELAAVTTANAVTVSVPVSSRPGFELDLGALAGGRRLLSDDAAFLESVALVAAQRIDAIRMDRERYDRSVREQEISKLAAEAELRALQAQLNPHFLFNALTTIGYLIRTSPDRALETLMKLTGLLRAVLKRTAGEYVTLGEEIDLAEKYLGIERARFEERLNVTIDVDVSLRSALVPPLVVQPLAENAVKHGIAPRRAGGVVTISARRDSRTGEDVLVIDVVDTGPDHVRAVETSGSGVGLANIRTRLERYFGEAASIVFRSDPGSGTAVTITMPYREGITQHTSPGSMEDDRRTA